MRCSRAVCFLAPSVKPTGAALMRHNNNNNNNEDFTTTTRGSPDLHRLVLNYDNGPNSSLYHHDRNTHLNDNNNNNNNNLQEMPPYYYHYYYHANDAEDAFFSPFPFSGSAVASLTTFASILLFLTTYTYLIGRPVYDAHQLLWSVSSGVGGGVSVSAQHTDLGSSSSSGGDDASDGPVEEEDDMMKK